MRASHNTAYPVQEFFTFIIQGKKNSKINNFLEDINTSTWTPGQERFATIRATPEQHSQELNVFASAVKWERV